MAKKDYPEMLYTRLVNPGTEDEYMLVGPDVRNVSDDAVGDNIAVYAVLLLILVELLLICVGVYYGPIATLGLGIVLMFAMPAMVTRRVHFGAGDRGRRASGSARLGRTARVELIGA